MAVDFDALVLRPAHAAFANVSFAYAPPVLAGVAATGRGIFDRHAASVRMEGDVEIGVRMPRIGVRLADFAEGEPQENGVLTLTWTASRAGVPAGSAAGRWRITGVDPDGEGGAMLTLSSLSGPALG